MLVKNWMTKNVITVDVDDSMHGATKLLKENDIRILPVMDKGKLVGILTDGDLKKASASDANTLEIHELFYLLSEIKVKEIMTKKPIIVPLDFTVEETADILLQNKIPGVPVVDDDGRVKGIITESDIFRMMVSLSDISGKGFQFGLQLEDRPGSIKEICDIIRKYDGCITSILSTDEGAAKGFRKVYIRLYGVERNIIPQFKDELQKKATLAYMVDFGENTREIY